MAHPTAQLVASVAAWDKAPGPDHPNALAADGVWLRLLACGKTAAPELMDGFFAHFPLDALLGATDQHGRGALDVATPACKTNLQAKLYLDAKYDFDHRAPAVHQSKTCKVFLGLDHSGGVDAKDNGTDDDRKDNEGKGAPTCSDDPPPTPVALKFMRNQDQWQRELDARQGLDTAYVIGVLRAHDGEADAGFNAALVARDLADYPYVLVLPRADLSLADALQHEHLAPSPEEVSWGEVQNIIKQIAMALQHFHTARSTIHGDVKPLNLMRTGDRKSVV